MEQLSRAKRIVDEMPEHDPVPLLISVKSTSKSDVGRKPAQSLGARRRALRARHEGLKQDLLAYIQTQQDGQASIINALPGTNQVIVQAPKSWWRKELLGNGKLASMSLGLLPNRKSAYLID